MNLNGKKVNFNEGFYRIFILVAIIAGIVMFNICREATNNWYLWLLSGIAMFIVVYISFFVIEWIIVGFCGEVEHNGIRGFINEMISRIVNNNYTMPFYIVLILFIVTMSIGYYQYKLMQRNIDYLENDNYALKEDVKNWKNSSDEHYRALQECKEELELQPIRNSISSYSKSLKYNF